MRPTDISISLVSAWLGLVGAAVNHLDSAAIMDLPGFQGIEKAVSARKVVRLSTSPTPQRLALGSIIDRRSFCASNQQSCT